MKIFKKNKLIPFYLMKTFTTRKGVKTLEKFMRFACDVRVYKENNKIVIENLTPFKQGEGAIVYAKPKTPCDFLEVIAKTPTVVRRIEEFTP